MKLVGLFSLSSGALLETATGSLHVHESLKFPRFRGQGGRSPFRKDCQHATNTSYL